MNSQVYAQPSLLAGAKAPECLRITILPGELNLDLRTVESVSLQVHSGYGLDQTWGAGIASQLRDRLQVTHVFDADGVETRLPGKYRVTPILTLANSAGVRRAMPFFLAVET